MPKLLELRPNHNYLDSNFSGYKLSLETIPIIKETLPIKVDTALPATDQFSFLHTKLFTLHNHLVGEIDNEAGEVYFVNEARQVHKAYLEEFTKCLIIQQVWEVPNKERREGDYNFSIKFASGDLVLISDGTGELYIVNRTPQWTCIFSDEVIGPDKKFLIQDVRLFDSKLHCLLFSIEQSENKPVSTLHWVTLTQADGKWGCVALRELQVKGDLHYAYLEPECKSVYVASDNGCTFTLDSENPIKEKKIEPQKKYEWMQSTDDITIKIELPEGFKKDGIRVEATLNDICVCYENTELLKGKLVSNVSAELTTWTTSANKLEVVLVKENNSTWPNLIENDTNGVHLLDSSAVQEAHQKLERLCSDSMVSDSQCDQGPIFSRQQIEECDFEDDKVAVFERLCCETHEVTHRCNLGSQHVLLTGQLSDQLPPAMAIRYDVDACLWQPLKTGDEFSLNHEATLLAFGYVQASKQQKKFSACAPDLNYSVICEASRHIFIYRQCKSIRNAELRNRVTGRRYGTTAQQQVVTVAEDNILGLFATNTVLYVLSEDSILALQL